MLKDFKFLSLSPIIDRVLWVQGPAYTVLTIMYGILVYPFLCLLTCTKDSLNPFQPLLGALLINIHCVGTSWGGVVSEY